MIRTTKKDIDNEIRAGRYTEILDGNTARYCRNQCKQIAFSCGTYGCTGIVFVAYNGEVYATTSRAIIGIYLNTYEKKLRKEIGGNY